MSTSWLDLVKEWTRPPLHIKKNRQVASANLHTWDFPVRCAINAAKGDQLDWSGTTTFNLPEFGART
jgi:hypothetical protein